MHVCVLPSTLTLSSDHNLFPPFDSPREELAWLGQSQRELCPAVDLDHILSHQLLYQLGCLAAVTAATPQLAIVTVSPAVHCACEQTLPHVTLHGTLKWLISYCTGYNKLTTFSKHLGVLPTTTSKPAVASSWPIPSPVRSTGGSPESRAGPCLGK